MCIFTVTDKSAKLLLHYQPTHPWKRIFSSSSLENISSEKKKKVSENMDFDEAGGNVQ